MHKIKEKFREIVWDADINALPWWHASIIGCLRFLHIMIVDFFDGQLNLRAMSLVFTTMLSIVPLIAVSFSVMKAFGAHNQMEPILLNYLAPLGTQGEEIAQQVMGFVDNIKVGALGGVGLALLFWIIIRLIKKIELAFNYTWRVKQTGSLIRRLGNYVIVIFLGPILIFSAIAITGTAMNSTVAQAILSVEPFGTLLSFATRLLPYLLIIAAFTFTYLFIPNIRVRFIPALTGGIAAGILWQTVGWVFATFISASMTTSYTAIYSSFAFLFVFMIWLWWSWLILLAGSSVAFFKQYPEYLFINSHHLSLTNRQKEELALEIMSIVGHRLYSNKPPISVNGLVESLKLPKQSIEQQISLLEAHGMLLKTDLEDLTYAPARALEELTLKEVINSVREPDPNSLMKATLNKRFTTINNLLYTVDNEMDRVLGAKTIKDIIKEQYGDAEHRKNEAVISITDGVTAGVKNTNE